MEGAICCGFMHRRVGNVKRGGIGTAGLMPSSQPACDEALRPHSVAQPDHSSCSEVTPFTNGYHKADAITSTILP